MREPPKKNKIVKMLALAGFSGFILLINACSSTPILQDFGDVPPPSLAPDGTAQASSPVAPVATSAVSTAPVSTTQTVAVTPKSTVPQVKYTVKKGDSLWKIAKVYDISPNELAAYNKIDPKSPIKVGQTLQIPPTGLSKPVALTPSAAINQASASSKVAAPLSDSVYTVKSGDSLWTIAKRNNISVKQIASANNISPDAQLKVGQKLTIPNGAKSSIAASPASSGQSFPEKPAPQTSAPASSVSAPSQDVKQQTNLINASTASTPTQPSQSSITQPATSPTASSLAVSGSETYLPHTVRTGDSWQTISDMYGVSIDDLKKVNPSIANEAQPKVGIVVNIPED